MTSTRRIETAAGVFTVHIEGTGPRLLNLHGLTGLAEKSRESAPSGFETATFDQRGHGDGPRFHDAVDFGIDRFVGDAIEVLDGLGWDRVAVGGQSMGAAIALRLALDHPERVDQLLITAPAFGRVINPGAQRLSVMADNLQGAVDVDETIAAMRSRLEGDGMPRDVSAFVESFRAHHFPSIGAAVRVVHRWAPLPDLDRLAELGVPAVVLGWPDDPLHPWDLAEETATILSARLGSIDHVSTALTNPAAIGRALDDLLVQG